MSEKATKRLETFKERLYRFLTGRKPASDVITWDSRNKGIRKGRK